MTISKGWEWEKENNPIWLSPSEESYYLENRWKEAGFTNILDFGCGLGRHSILFAKNGFKVSSFDLSVEAVKHLEKWAERENLKIDTKVTDMLSLPYADNFFDCIFAFHVISHTDTEGMKIIISEIKRVLKSGGEIYLTLCSKDTWHSKTLAILNWMKIQLLKRMKVLRKVSLIFMSP